MSSNGNSSANRFLFATGIECSYPVITGKDGQRHRVDEMEKAFHYKHWKQDLELVREMGLRYLRYGPPYYKVHQGAGRYDWEFTDLALAEIRRLKIVPIVDLCHFGLPDWIGDFQNPDWPELFAQYASAFAARFPWVQFYTPVNEINVCAKFSALSGLWNEQMKSDRAFVTALKHLSRANLLAIGAILKLQPDATFIQSEAAEYYHAGGEDAETIKRARVANNRRFLSFDLLYSVSPCTDVGFYLLDNGMTREEYEWFMSHGLGEHIIMGNDFYERNEHITLPGGGTRPSGEVYGWSPITRQYYERYRRPVMHTETNTPDVEDAPRWLWKEFFNVLHLRAQGVPVLGFTWYSLTDQVDWDSGLADDLNRVYPCGLYDLQRRPRPVAAAYKELLAQFKSQSLFPANRKLAIVEGGRVAPAGIKIHPKPHHRVEERIERPERATVAIARTTDTGIEAEGIQQLVSEAVGHLGGMRRFVRRGQTVLIKPNQTVWRLAKDGCTTDPRVVAALVRLAKEAGAGVVQVGECSSCGQITRETMKITGMARAAEEAGAALVYFDEVEQIETEVPRGKIIRKIAIPKPLLEADVVIACPKLKTHFLDPITGALKLWVGAVRQDTMHRLHRDEVQETVADLLTVTRPDLAVMDAVIAGEGNGPIASRGRFLGCILASDDPVALDVIAAELAGFDGEAMNFVRAAAERGIGINRKDRIDVLGASVAAAAVRLQPERMEGWENSYPLRVIIGEGVTMAGTLGHFKGFADYWQKEHLWEPVIALHGRPTFLMGRAEDPDFEAHLKEGKYFVLDDTALDKYKHDPRVTFIPGSPIGNEMMPAILEALDIEFPAHIFENAVKTWNRAEAELVYR